MEVGVQVLNFLSKNDLYLEEKNYQYKLEGENNFIVFEDKENNFLWNHFGKIEKSFSLLLILFFLDFFLKKRESSLLEYIKNQLK